MKMAVRKRGRPRKYDDGISKEELPSYLYVMSYLKSKQPDLYEACQSVYTNKKRQRIAAEKRMSTTQKKAHLVELAGGVCADCGGEFHPQAFDFHHSDPTTKVASVSSMIKKFQWDKVKSEVKKCILLCANCHRTRHALERMSSITSTEVI